jgi:lysine 6-dehydrogenase
MDGLVYAVLGAGRQGLAAAHDLALRGRARSIVLADRDPALARRGAVRLNEMLGLSIVQGVACDATQPEQLHRVLQPATAALCALPYPLIPQAAQAAINTHCSMADLGGNEAVTRQVLGMDDAARRARVTLVPDCGVAPGLVATLAAHLLARFEQPRTVRLRCGGLPQDRDSPLGYRLSFSVQGLVNEYSGEAEVLRGGRRERLPTLTEHESIELPEPFGPCEAFLTAGATSTLCESYEGRVSELDYKTVRYPGHCAALLGFRDLGLWSEEPVVVRGARVRPRDLFEHLAENVWGGELRDQLILRAEVAGAHEGREQTWRLDVIDRFDEATGFTAMQRMTGYPAAMVVEMLARGVAQPGAQPVERALPPAPLVEGLAERGIRVTETRR